MIEGIISNRAAVKWLVLCCPLLITCSCSNPRWDVTKQQKPSSTNQVPRHDSQGNVPTIGSAEWYKSEVEKADNGDLMSQERIADCYNVGACGFSKNQTEAMHYFGLAAQQGSTYAMAYLARGYQFGLSGLNKDLKEAAIWWRKAADAGDPGAADILGAFYEEGDGVPQSFSEALKWYRLSAEAGDGQAQQSLGEMYVKGIGVQRDRVQAHMWLNLACANRLEAPDIETAKLLGPSPCFLRDRLASQMTADQVVEAQNMASKWRPHGPRGSPVEANQK